MSKVREKRCSNAGLINEKESLPLFFFSEIIPRYYNFSLKNVGTLKMFDVLNFDPKIVCKRLSSIIQLVSSLKIKKKT